MKNKVFVISGPTASGKTLLATELAKVANGVVANADSCQMYDGLPILSAQPTAEEMGSIGHRLYGILEPNEQNTVHRWLELMEEEGKNIFNAGKNIVAVGGSGMYISRLLGGIADIPNTDPNVRREAIELYNKIGGEEFHKMVKKIDPEETERISKNDSRRLIKIYEIYRLCDKKASDLKNGKNKKIFSDGQFFHINILPNREDVYGRCGERFMNMIGGGVLEEVENFVEDNQKLLDDGGHYPICDTIAFLEIWDFLRGKITREEMADLSIRKTKNYAKRQYTWFRNQFKKVDFLIEIIPNRDNCWALARDIVNKAEKKDEWL
ncbi:MAG: tRNA (adenosine(37)-N6)-dimethylallyltransferase MiaA [Rickettsiales bacterium]|nr:tRNA (adenosine(37)-N6)-dimethylallyltransferase MiaA [Rickettsiales bacterium]